MANQLVFLIGCSADAEIQSGACGKCLAATASQTADYIVHPGDTIYSIAWQFGLNYTVLAQVNHLKPPYSIYSWATFKDDQRRAGRRLRDYAPENCNPSSAAPKRFIRAIHHGNGPRWEKWCEGYSPFDRKCRN